MASATGATMSTVATLSTKAEMMPANSASATAAICTLGTLSMIISARRAGMRLSMNSCTRPIVPAIISSTFQSIAPKIWSNGSMPVAMKTTAEPSAM